MTKVQKTYTQEFKREAVHLAQTSGKPIAQVARELVISDTSIQQWRKELAEHGQEAFPGSGHQTAQEEELRRLKRELERTQKERDIFKKAVAIFSQNQIHNPERLLYLEHRKPWFQAFCQGTRTSTIVRFRRISAQEKLLVCCIFAFSV